MHVASQTRKMPDKDDSEKEAKISDSACLNCRNSQSRQSHSSHSGSNSSESSGYGGKQSTSDSSSKIVPTSEKQQEGKGKRKRAYKKLALLECRPPEPIPMIEAKKINDVNPESMDVTPPVSETELPHSSLPMAVPMDQGSQPDEIRTKAHATEVVTLKSPELEGFSCAISMRDGVVIYTTQNLSAHLGFPKGMWIGRSFIDFLHPLDRDTFASQITSSLAIPTTANPAPTQRQGSYLIDDQQNQMACRIRRYKSLSFGYAVKDRVVTYVPFLLNFSFKEIKDNNGNLIYLIVKATPLHPAYNSPNERIVNRTPFVIRHSATGAVEYIDIQSVQYLGYLPQDIHNQDALKMYHPDDLPALKTAYEIFVSDGVLAKSMPFRMMAQNGDYVKLETEWTSYTNPWSMKLEFVIGKHYVLEGPTTPDVFKAPPPPSVRSEQMTVEEKLKIDAVYLNNQNNLLILRGILSKPAENAKQELTDRVNKIIKIMEDILDEQKEAERVRIKTPVIDNEQNSDILGSISPHHDSIDSISTGGTSLSYTQLNYNDNLQRYFDSHLKNRRVQTISPPFQLARDCKNVFIDQKSLANAVVTIKSHLSQRASKNLNSAPDSSSLSSMTTDMSPSETDFAPARLTESLLIRHNSAMEKKLVNNHRGGRSCNLNERVSDTNRQKTKEHLARCNAAYQPTKAIDADEAIPSRGLKRSVMDIENKVPAKQPCLQRASNSSPPGTTNVGNAQPIYYPRTVTPIRPPAKKLTAEDLSQSYPQISHLNHQPTHMPWTCPLPVYGSPFMHPPMPLHMQKQHMKIAARLRAASAAPIDLRVTKTATRMRQTKKADNTSFKGTEPEVKPEPRPVVKKNTEKSTGPFEEDRTDDSESSSSSFYSSFLRTESGSMYSSDQKKHCLEMPKKENTAFYTYEPVSAVKTPQNKIDSTWVQVCGTRNLDFNYQVPMKTKQETLDDNTKKIRLMTQPCLVNEQLGQLYKDLHLEGATARLTLEEGITSSSGESTLTEPKPKGVFCKRNYSKLSLVYEENAPVPPPCASVSPIDPSLPPSEKDTSSGDADVSN